MALSQNLVPMRWPSGPVEISRRQQSEGFTPQAQQTLTRWHEPAALELLKDTPVNCLVISWAAGLPEDAQQQNTAAPLVGEANRRKLSVVGWVEGTADHNAALGAARAAGLSAVAIEDFKGKPNPLVIAWGDRAGAPWDSTAPVLPITGNVWPGVAGRQDGGTSAGPTSLPWLDSNGWYIQLARARARADLWIMFDPPGGRTVVPAQSYPTAVCDSEASGGRWVISLDDSLRARLAEGEAAAQQTWKGIAATTAFFQRHSVWKSYRPLGNIGIISDFSGENFDMSGEILNLMSRKGALYRIIWKQTAGAQLFTGLKELVYADGAPPPKELRQEILRFVANGGLLVTGPKWGSEGKSLGPDVHPRFDVRALGKGRLAVAKEDLADPYQIAIDTQILLSHANDQVRLFGGGASGGYHLTGSADGKSALLQLLTYASARGNSQMTVWVDRNVRSSRLWSIQAVEPSPVAQVAGEYGGTEFHVGSMPAYAALELTV
jgi:hypothetical protein